jgi:small conductance mechanosensitive channel
MHWLAPLVLVMQPANDAPAATEGVTDAPADPAQEAANQAALDAAPALTPADATEETLRRFNSFDSFFQTENLVYLWEVYGIPAVKALAIFAIAWFVAGQVKRIMASALLRAKVEATLAKFLANLVRWAILLLGAMSVLDTLGIKTTSFAAVIAAMGFAIGLALSGSLGNLASGVMLMLFRPFKVGDTIVTGGVTGTVDEIELFSTTIITPDNRKFIMPNGSVFNTTIENQTANPTRAASVTITVGGASDIERVRGIFQEAARGVAGRIAEKDPAVLLSDLTGGQVWTISVWAPTASFGPVRERLLIACKQAVDRNALGVPMAQSIINYRAMTEPPAVPLPGVKPATTAS